MTNFAIGDLRNEFPVLHSKVHGRDLVYLDSAATTLKPRRVVEAMNQFNLFEASNVHRGAHYLSSKATESFEGVRSKTQRFINATSSDEIIFTSGTTAAINMVAASLAKGYLKAGDEIVLSEMEHHSNIVPWQIVARDIGCKVRFAPIKQDGALDLQALHDMISAKTKILSLALISNVLGTINPLKEIFKLAKKYDVVTVVDAAQAVAIQPVDVQDLNCDFLTFSAHKMFGPFGVGVLYGKKDWLEKLPPSLGGGGMIGEVTRDGFTTADLPYKFEAGTPNIAGVIGFGAAIDFIKAYDFKAISNYELNLRKTLEKHLESLEGLQVYGTTADKAAILSFNLESHHASDVASILDQQGIAVRAGHHCAQILMNRLKVPATVRASFSLYNNDSDINRLIEGIKKARELLS